MNVLHLTVRYSPPMDGGLPRQVHGLAHALSTDHNVGVVTMGEDRMDGSVRVIGAEEIHASLPTHELPGLARANMALCGALVRAVAMSDWDVVHAHDWMVAPAANMARHALGLQVVATFHADSGAESVGTAEDRERRLDWERSLVNSATQVLACGRQLAGAVQSRHPESQVTYVPNGVWTESFSATEASVERSPERILFVGRLVPYKGCQDLIRAVALLKPAWPEIELHIVGDGFYRPELERLVADLGLKENVVFQGWLAGEDLAHAYQSASIVAVPSHEEAFGLVALEAMASGAAVIATTVGAFPDMITSEHTGLLVPVAQPDVLARQIERLLRDPDWRAAMVAAAQEQVVPEYDWSRVVHQTVAVYEAVA